MRKIALIMILILIFNIKETKAQFSSNVDSLVRDLFFPLTPPSPQSPFLFDMSAHFIDDKYFSNTNSVDTFNSKVWFSVYNEMRKAAYDTSIMPNGWSLRYKVQNYTKDNIVPVGLFYADYHKIIDSAFTDSLKGTYFEWDDDSLWDVSLRPTSPYLNKTLFVGSALKDFNYFKDVKFVIDSSLLFYNDLFKNSSSGVDTSLRLAIDFSDGLGYKLFRLDTITYYNVSYPDSGSYLIKFALASPNTEGGYSSIEYLSKSYFYVATNETPIVLNNDIIIEGLNVSYVLGCDNLTLRKPIIYLEGFDYFEDRHTDKIYSDCIKSPRVVELLNYGYDLVMVDWKNSKSDLRSNAMRIVYLIDYLKCLISAEDENNEAFVVIGESMGGVIGRLALAYMESDDYASSTPAGIPYYLYAGEDEPEQGECINTLIDLKARKHNTRLFISIDSPHQGANSPIAIQLLYKSFVEDNIFAKELNTYTSLQDVFFNAKYHMDNVVSSYAIKQLLIYELSTGISTKNYTSNALRDEFLETLYSYPNREVPDLKAGYPQECKLMAISNGLLTQQNQQKIEYVPASNGDELAHLFLDVRSALFGFIKTKRRQYDMHLYTVPDPNGVIFTNDKIETKFKLKGCLRSFFKKSGSCWKFEKTSSESFECDNVEPIDVNSGGNAYVMPAKSLLVGVPTEMDYFIFGYGFNVDYSNGNVNIEAKYLVDVFVCRNVTINFSTNACFYNHIPVHSALDFDKGKKLGSWDYPIYFDYTDPGYSSYISNIFDNTPFDVYYGGVNLDYTNPYSGANYDEQSLDKNMEHVYYHVFNMVPSNPRFVNLEIGDSHMYLENYKAVANFLYWPSQYVGVGKRNPYYSYFDNFYSLHMYSRANPFDWNSKSLIIKTNTIETNSGNVINVGDRYEYEEEGYDPCTVEYRPIIKNEIVENNNLSVSTYPNPTNGDLFIQFDSDSKVSNFKIFNVIGKEINDFELISESNLIKIHLGIGLTAGFYYIRFDYDDKQQKVPIILNR